MNRSNARERLQRAVGRGRIVKIDRRSDRSSPHSGFVVAVGRKWALLAATRGGGFPDGHVAVRLSDVRRVRVDRSTESRAARLLPTWPPTAPPRVELDTTAGMLRTLAADGELVGIETARRVGAMWIGLVEAVTRHWVWLWEVRPNGTWRSAPLGYRLGRLVAVTTGDGYFRGLAAVADPAPEGAGGRASGVLVADAWTLDDRPGHRRADTPSHTDDQEPRPSEA